MVNEKRQSNKVCLVLKMCKYVDNNLIECFILILEELNKANEKHPVFCDKIEQGICVIGEEYGEVCKAFNDGDSKNLKIELAQLATTAIRAIYFLENENRKKA